MNLSKTVALYKRILLLLKPQELHCSSNFVLHDELLGLKTSIDNIVATFAKVTEVRDAVNQLEQGKPSSGRSASLMDVMDKTLDLQEILQQKLRNVAAGMDVMEQTFGHEGEKVKRKRKGADNEQAYPSSEEEEKRKTKKQKGDTKVVKNENPKTKSEGNSRDWTLASDALNAILKVQIVDQQVAGESKKQLAIALSAIKRVLEHQSHHDAHTTDNAAVEVTARALEALVSVFQQIQWTAERTNEVQAMTTALTDACAKNEVLRIFFQRARAEVAKIIPMKNSVSPSKQNGASEGSSLHHQIQIYDDLVDSMIAQPPETICDSILKALYVMQQVMASDAMGIYKNKVQASIKNVKVWIKKTAIRNDMIHEYRCFADSVTTYSKRFSDKRQQKEWEGLGVSILTLLNEKMNPIKPHATKLPSKCSSKIREMQRRLKFVIKQAQKWQHGGFSLDQLDDMFKALNGIMSYRPKIWKQCEGNDLRDCLRLVATCVGTIKKKEYREARLKTLGKWETAIKK